MRVCLDFVLVVFFLVVSHSNGCASVSVCAFRLFLSLFSHFVFYNNQSKIDHIKVGTSL